MTSSQPDPVNTRKHVKYPKTYSEYAVFYGKDERTIKRLVRRGKELGNLPPLDDPPKMAAWWRGSMDSVVPDWLLGFIIADPIAPSGGAAATHASPGDAGSQRPRDFSQIKGLDLADNVAELRRTHAINKQLLDEALHANPPNDTLTQLRQKNFERSFDLLRVSETTLQKFQKDAGDLIDKEAVKSEIAQLLEALRLMRETMPRRILIALEQLLPRRLQRILAKLEFFLIPAIEKARADEENIFRNLDLLDGLEAVEKLLAA